MNNPFTWEYLTTAPATEDVFDVFGIVCLTIFVLGFVGSLILSNDGGRRFARHPLTRRLLRRAGGMGTAIFGAGLFYMLTRSYLGIRRTRRLKALENQLPDAIDVLAGALEAGSSLPQSMAMAGRELSDPISTEFNRVVRDQELGLSQQEALARMLERCPSQDLDMLVSCINIQYRVGGNLSKVLRTISHTIRERLRIRREIQILTAQGRISAKIITAVPFFLGGVIFLINRGYMSQLFTTSIGLTMVGVAMVMTVIGYIVMNRIVSIKV